MTNVKTLFRAGNTGVVGKLFFVVVAYIASSFGTGFAATTVFWAAYLPITAVATATLLCTMMVVRGYFVVNHPDKMKQWRQKNIDMSFDIGAGSIFFWFAYMVKELWLLAIKRPSPLPEGK